MIKSVEVTDVAAGFFGLSKKLFDKTILLLQSYKTLRSKLECL